MQAAASGHQANYSIGVVARLTGLTTHTLRMWERRYGLGASKRTDSGQRQFTKVDLDHLKLVKMLVDEGMRIGDIAKLPKKTLSAMRLQNNTRVFDLSSIESIDTIVMGSALCDYFTSHIKRYPQLNIEIPELAVENWLLQHSHTSTARIVILQLDTIKKSAISSLTELAKGGRSIHIQYQFAIPEQLALLQSQGINLFREKPAMELIDSLVKKSIEQQTTKSLLKQSAEEFDVDLPSQKPRYFDQSQLDEAETLSRRLACECPAHLAKIINNLNAFEDYSQECGAENWQQAATHACLYAYTSQARHLMEKALLAVLNEDQ